MLMRDYSFPSNNSSVASAAQYFGAYGSGAASRWAAEVASSTFLHCPCATWRAWRHPPSFVSSKFLRQLHAIAPEIGRFEFASM